MVKLLTIFLVLLYILIPTNYSEARTKFVKGDFYEGTLKWKKMRVDLPDGKWEYIRQSSWWWAGFGYSCKSFILKEGRIFKSLMSMCEMRTAGRYTANVGAVLNKYYKRGEYDSCTLRPEYFYANLYLKGTSSNCFRIRHIDHDKEMNRPDDPDDVGGLRPILRKWFKENNVEEPKILLAATHEYFAPVVTENGPGVYFLINPEAYGGPKNKYFTEETSEYHRNNIDKHPEFKKFMDEFTSLSAKRHKEFETLWKARKKHKLDLSDVILDEKDIVSVESDTDIVKRLNELKELLEAGVITKEEFKKAKKKLLN